MSDINPEKLKVVELRAELAARGLDTKGNKPVLIDRLKEALEQEQNEAEAGAPAAEASEEEEEEEESDAPEPESSVPDDEIPPPVEENQPESTVTESPVEESQPVVEEVPIREPSPEPEPVEEPAKVEEPVNVEPTPEPEKVPSPVPVKESTPEPIKEEIKPVPEVEMKPEPLTVNTEAMEVEVSETKVSENNLKDKEEEPEEEMDLEGDIDAKVSKYKEKCKYECILSDDEIKLLINLKENKANVKISDGVCDFEAGTMPPDPSAHAEEKGQITTKGRSPSPDFESKLVAEDEPTIDENTIGLSWYDSDLNLIIDKTNFLSAEPLHHDGFAFVWAGVRSTFGVKEGLVYYEVKVVRHLNVEHLQNEEYPHVVRLGWSVPSASMQLGEESLSFGFGGTGKVACNNKFRDYGQQFQENDVVHAYLDMTGDNIKMSYAVNGHDYGIAFEVPRGKLNNQALFPHILTKNSNFVVNFGASPPAFPPKEGYISLIEMGPEKLTAGPRRPAAKSDCEMIMLCGLPGCGKTYWAGKYVAQHPEKLYNILGTNALIDKMRVMGLSRKRNYNGRWEELIEKCNKCLLDLLKLAAGRRRNYILDQTNCYPSAQRKKMKHFEGFIRKAVVIVPTDEEFKRRVEKREREEGKDIPENAVLEMKANFQLPTKGEFFDEVINTELPEPEAKTVVEMYNKEANSKGFMALVPSGASSVGTVSGGGGGGGGAPKRPREDNWNRNDNKRFHQDNRGGGGGGRYDRDNDRRGGGGHWNRDRDRNNWRDSHHRGRDDRGGGWRDRDRDNRGYGRSDRDRDRGDRDYDRRDRRDRYGSSGGYGGSSSGRSYDGGSSGSTGGSAGYAHSTTSYGGYGQSYGAQPAAYSTSQGYGTSQAGYAGYGQQYPAGYGQQQQQQPQQYGTWQQAGYGTYQTTGQYPPGYPNYSGGSQK